MSESDDDADQVRPVKKSKTANEDSAAVATPPKWCNPDPYTALPPAVENAGKRTDVLKLIRKAKITNDREKADEIADSKDFISFDDLDGDDASNDSVVMQDELAGRRSQFDGPAGESLGKRKRDFEEAVPRPPGGYLPPDDRVLPEWTALDNVNATPWVKPHANSDTPGIA